MQRSPGFWDNAGGEAVFEAQSNSDGRELRLQNEMLTWKTSQLGFPLERPVVITEIWQDRHRSVQNSHTLKWAEIGRLSRPTIQNRHVLLELQFGIAATPNQPCCEVLEPSSR
jgi:hypothetical protein